MEPKISLRDRNNQISRFFYRCLVEIGRKSGDYNHDPEEGYGEIDETAADISVSRPQALYVHLRKHWSAIQKWMRGERLDSEEIHHRLKDAANYMALIDVAISGPQPGRVGTSIGQFEKRAVRRGLEGEGTPYLEVVLRTYVPVESEALVDALSFDLVVASEDASEYAAEPEELEKHEAILLHEEDPTDPDRDPVSGQPLGEECLSVRCHNRVEYNSNMRFCGRCVFEMHNDTHGR